MKNIQLLLVVCLIFPALAKAQIDFKFDNTVYKTIFSQDFCDFLKANPNTLLVDVRSPGEYSDTSEHSSLNIGHLKNAINIPIDSIEKNPEILRDKSYLPIVLYCSHSQRSRRVSKILTENNYPKVWNLNGGMSVLNQTNLVDFPCKKEMIVSALPYQNIPANEALQLIKTTKDILILDVRPVSQFEGKDTIQSLNIGRLKNAANIPFNQIKDNLEKIDHNKTILVYDNNGREGNNTAKYLYDNGFKNVYNLLGGLSAVVGKDTETLKIRKNALTNVPEYKILNTFETITLLQDHKDVFVIDARTSEEFSNHAKEHWRNLGHVKNAVNIPPSEFGSRKGELLKHKKSKILIYGPEAATYSKSLKEMGFTDVNWAYGGLWDIISVSFNIKGLSDARNLLVDHEGLY
jgi:rhodanese-related sulfurtransferase